MILKAPWGEEKERTLIANDNIIPKAVITVVVDLAAVTVTLPSASTHWSSSGLTSKNLSHSLHLVVIKSWHSFQL